MRRDRQASSALLTTMQRELSSTVIIHTSSIAIVVSMYLAHSARQLGRSREVCNAQQSHRNATLRRHAVMPHHT